VPERLPSGACFPNNDSDSRHDLEECEPAEIWQKVVGEPDTAEVAGREN
jgi:hypothetical protein